MIRRTLAGVPCPREGGIVEEMKTMNNTTLAEALFALAAALAAQPAETVTQAVVSVAKTGQRRIKQSVMTKVKAQRMRNGGSVPNGIPCWQLIDDGIIDAEGNLIADAKAPTATKTTVTNASKTMSKRDADDLARIQKRYGMKVL